MHTTARKKTSVSANNTSPSEIMSGEPDDLALASMPRIVTKR